MHDEERAALAQLCEQLPELRAEVSQHPAATQDILGQIEAEARSGRPIQALLVTLLDRLSVDRHGDRGSRMTPLSGLGPGRASEERFGCPNGSCDREAKTAPAGPLPRCWVTGRFMKRRSAG